MPFSHPQRRRMLAGIGLAALAAPRLARAAVRTVRLGHNNVPEAPFGQGAQAIADAVAAHPVLAPVLRIDVRGRAELGDELALMNGCRDGTVDMGFAVTSLAANVVPEAGLLDTPFLFASAARGRAAMDGAIGAEYAALMAAAQLHVIGWAENGQRHFTANRPIRRPEDLRGLKLRVAQSPAMIASFTALGAQAGPLAYNDLHEALRTGRFEAQENPIGAIESGRFFEVQRVVSLSGHIYSTAMIMASADVLEDLTPPQQAALRECAGSGVARTRQIAEAAERDGVARLRTAGMSVVEDVDKAAFRAAMAPHMASMAQRFGAERVARLQAAG